MHGTYRFLAAYAMVSMAVVVAITSLLDDIIAVFFLMVMMGTISMVVVGLSLFEADWYTRRLLFSLGPSSYQFSVPSSWPIDGLMRFALERLAALGLTSFPMAREFLRLPPDVERSVRYCYVISPLGKQMLVLNCFSGSDDFQETKPIAREYYKVIVRPYDLGSAPGDDPVVSTIGALMLDFERVRVRRGYPSSIGRTEWFTKAA